MSHIQKILERAERDGSIRPGAVAEPPRASAVATQEPAYPIVPPAMPPLDAPALAPPPVDAPPVPMAPPPVASPARRVAPAQLDPRLGEVLTPGAATADQYRSLRTRIQQAANGRAVSALLVTSPARGEGRTQTAASLGLTMAQEFDRRVCIVDADLRRPDLRRRLGLPDGPGLADVLAGRATLDEALIHIEELHVTVLPGGTPTTETELLGTPAMRRTLQALRAQFDRIVIDGPAALPVSDVALLTPLVDGLMLVIRAGVTAKPTIHSAVESINSDKLLGVMLNDAR